MPTYCENTLGTWDSLGGAVGCRWHSTRCPGLTRGQLLGGLGGTVGLTFRVCGMIWNFLFSTACLKAWYSLHIFGPGHRIAQDLPSEEKSLVE